MSYNKLRIQLYILLNCQLCLIKLEQGSLKVFKWVDDAEKIVVLVVKLLSHLNAVLVSSTAIVWSWSENISCDKVKQQQQKETCKICVHVYSRQHFVSVNEEVRNIPAEHPQTISRCLLSKQASRKYFLK